MAAQGQGRLLGSRYRLRSEVGRGGMGTVWRAHDEVLDREVAVKEVLLPPGLSAEERDILYKRTFREARASARLNHPGVVTVHDVVSEGERPWIVMELVRARSLQEILDEGGPLPPRRAAAIGRQVLAALSHAHKAGILHRDVKPSNVLICEEDRAVLTDFGIAQMEGDATLTQTGLVMGSPAYIPPERVQGERAVPASDLWALGATLYTCVEGKAPYERPDAMAALAAALNEEVPPPRNAGPLRPVLDGLLVRSPADRMTAPAALALLTKIAAAPPTAPAASRQPRLTTTVLDPPAAEPAALETVKDPSLLQILPPVPSPRPAARPAPMPQTGQVSAVPHRPDAESPTKVQQPSLWQRLPPPPDYPPYPQPVAPASRNHNRTVVIVLVAAVLIAISLVVGALVLRGRAGSAGGQGGSGTTGSGGQQMSYETQQENGFTVSVPQGWKREAGDRGTVYFYGPSRSILLQVDPQPWTGTPLSNAILSASRGRANSRFPGYAPVGQGVVEVTYRNGNAADWEFTFNDPQTSVPQHTKDRFFVLGGHQYAIYFRTSQAGWSAAQPYLYHAYDTFKVA